MQRSQYLDILLHAYEGRATIQLTEYKTPGFGSQVMLPLEMSFFLVYYCAEKQQAMCESASSWWVTDTASLLSRLPWYKSYTFMPQ